MVRDPVCGMYLDSGRSTEQTIYRGDSYCFCYEGCRRLFEADPEGYLGRTGEVSDEDTSLGTLRLAGEAMQDLSPQARTLAAYCFACPGACQALEHLYQHPRTTMSLEDWAYELSRPEGEIANALTILEEWALVERIESVGLTFYRLTSRREPRLVVEEFLRWRRKWALQLDALGEMLKIEGGKEEPWFAIPSAG